ncbi:MAG TPA: hypothetical protein VLJ11_10465 [Bryobacteraceae bacterium]|nr:hypothetical protein [Bryobacteraceae bacterium]
MYKAVAIAAFATSFIAFASTTNDSEHLNKLLADAKTEAAGLQQDASELESYTRSTMAWQSHAAKLNDMKEHVNKAGQLVQELNNGKDQGSTWQQTAINRITPALREMADNLEATINSLNKNQGHVNLSTYKNYALANSELATDLSQIVGDFVTYGHAKSKFEKLGERLEVTER